MGGQWYQMPPAQENTVYNLVLHSLSAKSKQEWALPLEVYIPLISGEYRVVLGVLDPQRPRNYLFHLESRFRVE